MQQNITKIVKVLLVNLCSNSNYNNNSLTSIHKRMLVANGRNINLKNSFCGDEKDDVISYVSAIANMDGVHLVIGVHDKSLEVIGTDIYNYDCQKAFFRLTERCVNLSPADLT